MRDKIFAVMNKIYGMLLSISFFAGVLPIIPFIVALIIGGDVGEAISVFIYNKYYPVVISFTTISVIIGWIALYIGKKVKSEGKKKSSIKQPKEEIASNAENKN